MSEVKVNKISPRSGTTITLGDSGDTFTVPSGVTFDASSGGLAGTLTTAAQPNITSVGTLTSFSSTGIDDNATSTAITIDSSENVGIGSGNLGLGTSSVQNLSSGRSVLQINNTNDALINLSTSLTRRGYIYATTTGYNVFSASAIPLIFGTDGTEAMRIDSSGRVIIGGTTPDTSAKLTLEGGDLRFNTDDKGILWGNNEINGNNASDFINIVTAGSERMRIDSSGNLLVGTTSSSLNDVGFKALSGGTGTFTRDGSQALNLNRQTSDGEIVKLWKDGAEIGNIGAIGGDLAIGTGDAGLRFYNSGDSIFPVNTSSSYGVNDNATDLGYSGTKKELGHLVYLLQEEIFL
jgi:hypothetical protein